MHTSKSHDFFIEAYWTLIWSKAGKEKPTEFFKWDKLNC